MELVFIYNWKKNTQPAFFYVFYFFYIHLYKRGRFGVQDFSVSNI